MAAKKRSIPRCSSSTTKFLLFLLLRGARYCLRPPRLLREVSSPPLRLPTSQCLGPTPCPFRRPRLPIEIRCGVNFHLAFPPRSGVARRLAEAVITLPSTSTPPTQTASTTRTTAPTPSAGPYLSLATPASSSPHTPLPPPTRPSLMSSHGTGWRDSTSPAARHSPPRASASMASSATTLTSFIPADRTASLGRPSPTPTPSTTPT
mmetsp:Transcript_35278/g.105396  ORF Transcript_35278/g.105396 Transcript_35278/m.105396 type:complete len:206 (+) Transcript_35278:1614-2231(+)